MRCGLSAPDPEHFVLLVLGSGALVCNDEPAQVSMVVDLYRGLPPGNLVDRNRRPDFDVGPYSLPVRTGCVSGPYYVTAQATVTAPPSYRPPLVQNLSVQSNVVSIMC
jgi:hypothetical protein